MGEREGVGWGSKGGGWRGGAGDQVIRIINLGSSCWGGGARKVSRDREGTRERRQLSPDGAEPRLELSRGTLNCGSPGSPPLPCSHPAALPGHCSPGGTFGLRERYLPQASGLRAQGILRARAWSPGAHCPRPAQRWRLREERLMLQGGKPKAREPQRRRDLARVNRLSPEPSVRATSQPDAPPSLPASRPSRPARPRRRPLSRNFPGIRLT